MPSRPGREETGRDRAARKGARGLARTARFAMAGAWSVLIERGTTESLFIASHRFAASPTRCQTIDNDWLEDSPLNDQQKQAARLVAQAQRSYAGSTDPNVCGDTELVKECPVFAAFMTCGVDEAGQVLKTATLTIFFEDGVFKGVLRDRNTDRTLWASCDELARLPGVFEVRLTQDIVEWRRSPMDRRDPRKK